MGNNIVSAREQSKTKIYAVRELQGRWYEKPAELTSGLRQDSQVNLEWKENVRFMVENIIAGVICAIVVIAGFIGWRLDNSKENEEKDDIC